MIGRQLDHSDVEQLPEGNSTLSYLVTFYFKHMVRDPGMVIHLWYTENLYNPQMLSFQSMIRTAGEDLGQVSVLEERERGAVWYLTGLIQDEQDTLGSFLME